MRSVDDELAAWRRELPKRDAETLVPILRALQLAESVDVFRRRVLEPFEISLAEYDVLAALRQEGMPYRLNPGTLAKRLSRSSGGMSKLLKRLETGGYVERQPDPEDGRGALVQLSRRGLDLQARIFGAFLAAADNRFEGMGRGRLAELESAMKAFCEALEH